MALREMIFKDAVRMYSQLLIINPLPVNSNRCIATQQGNLSKGSGQSSSYDSLPEGFAHPFVTHGQSSLKLRFTEQGRLMIYNIKHFYEDFTGNSEVREAQSKVNDLQHKLDIVMDKRNTSELELIEVKKQLAELNSSQQNVTHQDIEYLDFLKKEFKVRTCHPRSRDIVLHSGIITYSSPPLLQLLSEKQRLDGLIGLLNYEHQLLLMQLTHALNEVHAKERHEANTLRLVKVFLTTLVAVIGFAGNAGYNHYKDAKVQNHMMQQSTMLQTVLEYVEEEKSRKATASTESWGSYLYRQPGRLYGYLLPKQSTESWGSSLYRQPVRLYRYMFPKNP